MRVNHLDVARAVCIVLVVFGHSEIAKGHPYVNDVLASFRMPLFLIISGTFFQPLRGPGETLARKGDSLLKPYLTVALLYAPFYLMTSGHDDAWAYALGVLSFNGATMPGWLFPMWFLTLLWALHTGGALFVRLVRFDRLTRSWQFIWIALLMLFGHACINGLWMRTIHVGNLSWQLTGLPFNMDLWPLAMGFFLTGHVLKKEIRGSAPGWQLTGAAALLFALTHLLYRSPMSLLDRQYPNVFLNALQAFSGALLLIGLAHLIARSRRATQSLMPLGRLSLYILMFHAPALSLGGKKLSALWPSQPTLTEFTAIVVSLGVSVALGKMIEMTPFLRPFFEPREPAANRPVRGARGLPAMPAITPTADQTAVIRRAG